MMAPSFPHPGAPPPLLLRGGTVLTLDPRATVLSGDVQIEDGRIAAVGPGLAAPPGCRVVDVAGCLVLPGLIQGHVHLGQTFFRGLAEGRRLLAWLRERIWPLEAAHDDESAYWCTLLGAAECLLGGTTTVQDIGLGPGARGLLQALVDSRLRALAGQCLMDGGEGLPAALAGETDAVLASTVELGERYDGAGGGRLSYLLNPRFILSCSDPLWRGLRDVALARGWPVHTHAMEQQDEIAAVRATREGRDEIEYFDEAGVLSTDLRLAHGVWIPDAHLPRLAAARTSVVHCPSSNLKLGSGIADVVGLRRAGIAVGVGADGAPCNNRLDAFEEIRLAGLLQKLRHGPESFSGLDALRLATSEGARALGLGAEVGTVETGKAADLLVLSLGDPALFAAPEVDPHDLVAWGASRLAVRHVLVGGEALVEDGRLTHLDLEEILRRAGEELAKLLAR
ncbi:MAG: 5-methylthioadenosine/S-adenosylhomocysteine deaminase, partial [Acidobacteriota bacterium]|nr:5-methylthioadenosine/S-adenosylhomocysteine deaminase [Acidobacteriota bacterium]